MVIRNKNSHALQQHQAHGVRKSCREHTRNTKTNRVKWNQKLYKLSRGATRLLLL